MRAIIQRLLTLPFWVYLLLQLTVIVLSIMLNILYAESVLEYAFKDVAATLRNEGELPSEVEIVAIASLFLPLLIIGIATWQCFSARWNRKERLFQILTTYAGNVLVFTSYYYAMSCYADQMDRFTEAGYYQHLLERVDNHSAAETARLAADATLGEKDRVPFDYGSIMERKSLQAFSGVHASLVAGIFPFRNVIPESLDWQHRLELYRALGTSEMKIDRSARMPLFNECLHFSVATVTTLGYGDITPQSPIVRTFSDIQVLVGVFTFGLGLAMLFGNWWPEPPSVATDPPPPS
ncbi:MAG: potassium channel family protein [Planctomycetaceae bacterium]